MSGFSVLAYANPDSTLLLGVSDDARGRIERQLLNDFCCLVNVRWGMNCTIMEYEGTKYAYGNNPRFTASEKTIRNAIGDLSNHVSIVRSTANVDFEQLAEYKTCKMKWKVPDVVSESSTGWGATAQEEASPLLKRKRF